MKKYILLIAVFLSFSSYSQTLSFDSITSYKKEKAKNGTVEEINGTIIINEDKGTITVKAPGLYQVYRMKTLDSKGGSLFYNCEFRLNALDDLIDFMIVYDIGE